MEKQAVKKKIDSVVNKRLEIISLLKAGISIHIISWYCRCHISTVYRWNKRELATDVSRCGRPPVYNQEIQLSLIGFYCQSRPLQECGRWSVRMAAGFLKANPERLGYSIPKSTIHRILQKHNLKPHRSKYFLHISDPDFFPKMEHIISLYSKPPKNLFCFDESPGIQVLQRLVPDMRTEETKIRLEEFEYIRNGTIDLFACFEVATGRVFSECHACHDTEKLVGFMEKHFLTIPKNESIHYILDNLNTHCSYQVCILVAKHSHVKCPSEKKLDTMEKRRTWLTGTEKRIVFHFTPFHGSWLNMVEIWFGIMSGKCLKESFSSPEDMHENINAFVNLWNTFMAHPFNWQYTGNGLHEKAVTRFIGNLKLPDSMKMDLRVLTKQMHLIKNLFCQYHNKISEKCWNDFREIFRLKVTDFRKKIDQEPGAVRKMRARIALEELEFIIFKEIKLREEVAA